MSNIQKQHKISPAIAWLTIQKFIIFYCPLDGEHTKEAEKKMEQAEAKARNEKKRAEMEIRKTKKEVKDRIEKMRDKISQMFLLGSLSGIAVLGDVIREYLLVNLIVLFVFVNMGIILIRMYLRKSM